MSSLPWALRASILLVAAAVAAPAAQAAPAMVQQGPKLTPGETSGFTAFGWSVALSSDGNTALVGGRHAAWFYTRSGSTWTQQSKLTGDFGGDAALASDGNTALIGGPADSGNAGAAWVFTRSGSTWTQQGPKLTGDGEIGAGGFGHSLALSSAGTDALIGAPNDNGDTGAAWAFRLSGSSVTQQKLTGSGEVGAANFGNSVALSPDGGTALIGGFLDDHKGAAWTFTRTGSTWTQQGAKLTLGHSSAFGLSVALSSDGGTALIGGPSDSGREAAWPFARTGSTWTQQGPIVPNDESGGHVGGLFGASLALSADGNTALIGGPQDTGRGFPPAGSLGAAWVFARSGSTWTQQGPKLMGACEAGQGQFGRDVALSPDASTALMGGYNDGDPGTQAGAAWVFTTAAGPPPPPCPHTPTISGLIVVPFAFRAARAGTTVIYLDSDDATSTFTVLELRPGIRRKGKCVAARAHSRKGTRRCTRPVSRGSFSHADVSGGNSFHFDGRMGGRKLRPGRYLLRAVPVLGARTGNTETTGFRIVR